MQVHRNASRQNRNRSNKRPPQKPNNASHPLCSTTGFLAAWEPSSLVVGVADCCKLLQSVAGARRQPNTVANCFRRLQSVAICYKTQECVNLMSQHGRAITFLYEGAIRQHRWTRTHRRAAKEQVQT